MAENKSLGKIIGKGKRGVVRLGKFNGKVCAIKVPNAESTAINRLETESFWLEELNKYKIGPKFYGFDKSSLFMEYLEGVHLKDYLKTSSEVKTKSIMKKIMKQCRIMDKLRVNKFEMHRITTNVIVVKNNPVLIDFERCKRVLEPKNVTQFSQFLFKKYKYKDQKKLISLLKNYKSDFSEKSYKELLLYFF